MKQERIDRIFLTIGIIAVLTVGGILGWRIYKSHKSDQEKRAVGDEESDSFEWAGDYIDAVGLTTTMTMEAKGNSRYAVTITWAGTDGDELAIWKMNGYYDSRDRTLRYTDASRSDIDLDGGDDDEKDTAEKVEVYRNGEGYFYLEGGKVYWKDGTEDFGDGMQFDKSNGTDTEQVQR